MSMGMGASGMSTDGSAASSWTSSEPLACDSARSIRTVRSGATWPAGSDRSTPSAGGWAGADARSSAERTTATDRTASPIGLPSIEYIARIEVARTGAVCASATSCSVTAG